MFAEGVPPESPLNKIPVHALVDPATVVRILVGQATPIVSFITLF